MNAIGKATNHADVTHWFDLFGQAYRMDAFRAAVQRVMKNGAGAARDGKTMGNAVGRRAGNRADVIR